MNSASDPTDEELMAALARGDGQALAGLVERYQNDIFRFCLHYLKNVESAKEMAQETYLRIYSARARFEVSRKFKPWMLCIARNLCLNEIKRRKMVHMETLEEYASSARGESGEVMQAPADSPYEQLLTKERHRVLLEMLDTLADEAREIVVLRYFQKLSAREIAETVGSTEGAVRTRLHRVLKQLRNKFDLPRDDM
ncbi:MAG: sigma-70 family RNA polymerase sigma factor [Candidatus Hydrogenedentes bacterium]|nr:sigma-70 family RNA polymerase sigma factor [Candidatus Hydrogenedentota bacterium]